MPVDASNQMRLWTYTSDGGVSFNVRMSREHASVGSLGAGNPSGNYLPKGLRMRKLHGSTADGLRRTSVVIGSYSQLISKFNSGSFSWDGDTFIVTGYTGESFSATRIGT